jgi:hypothetical protein
VFALKNLLWALVVCFTILTAINLPALVIYGTGGFYNTYGKVIFGKLSLGNTGYNTAVCQTAPMALRELTFTCPVGLSTYIRGVNSDESYFLFGVNDLESNLTAKDNCKWNYRAEC